MIRAVNQTSALRLDSMSRSNVGQIIPMGERRWRVRWFLGCDEKTGKRRYGSKTVHGTKRQAQRVLRENVGSQDEGFAAPSPARIPRLSAYIERWKSAPRSG